MHELSPNNFGLIATEAVSEGETLMFIPDSQTITVSDENVLSESFKELQEKDAVKALSHPSNLIDLSLYILEQN